MKLLIITISILTSIMNYANEEDYSLIAICNGSSSSNEVIEIEFYLNDSGNELDNALIKVKKNKDEESISYPAWIFIQASYFPFGVQVSSIDAFNIYGDLPLKDVEDRQFASNDGVIAATLFSCTADF